MDLTLSNQALLLPLATVSPGAPCYSLIPVSSPTLCHLAPHQPTASKESLMSEANGLFSGFELSTFGLPLPF